MTREQPLDPFEREIRDALDQVAAEPAPDRLVSRVAAIPRHVQPGFPWTVRARAWLGASRRAILSFGIGLAAMGVVLVMAGAVLLGGPDARPSTGGPPSSVGPADRLASLARVIQSLPTIIRDLGLRRERGIGAVGPAGGPVPAGFQPVSATFASASEGWLLGAVPCTGGACSAAIVRTTDGGRTWAGIPAPQSVILPPDEAAGPGGVVRGLRFADALDGWAFGPALFATHDGGSTWRRVTLPGAAADAEVMALEASAGFVHAAFFDAEASVVRIATSPVGEDAWTVSPTTVPVGAGPVRHAQIVLRGTAGWLIEVDRAVAGSARLVSGAWQPWRPPCADLAGPATLAAASEGELVAACDVGLWSTPEGVHAYVSTDAGAFFTETAGRPPVFSLDGIAAPSASGIVVAGSLSGVGSALVASFDGGKAWDAVYVLAGAGSFSDLGFTTADQGVAITTSGTVSTAGVGEGHLIMTRDGGRTWSPVTIAGP